MKTCGKCGETKARSEFHKNPTKKDGVQTMCKECRKLYIRQHYKKNKETYIISAQKSKKRFREIIKRHKSYCGCNKCGEKRHWVLDYHHIRDKESEISTLIAQGAWKKVRIEIRKCIVLCSNCHRDLHYRMSQ
jgi:predicted transposase YbfD/YdcC